jgi:hypothetical protein
MKTCSCLPVILLLAGVMQPATAAVYDGSRPFRCVPMNITSCRSDGQCGKETPDSVELPRFLKFDIAQNQVSGTRPDGAVLTASIDKVLHLDDRVVLEGTEGPMMWSFMIAENSGNMTMTAGGEKAGFVAFGACSPD